MLGRVFSGGGAKGAFELGALCARCGVDVERRDLVQGAYVRDSPILVGTSFGAITAGFLAQYPLGSEKLRQGVLDLLGLMLGAVAKGSTGIYRKRTFGLLRALFKEADPHKPGWWGVPSLSTCEPLWALVRANIDTEKVKTSGRIVRLGAVSITTEGRGLAKVWTEKDHALWVDIIMASCSFPGEFPPVWVDGDRYTDWGARDIVPVQPAIEAGATELEVFLASPRESFKAPRRMSTLDVAQAVIDAFSNETKKGDLEVLASGLVPYRIFEPTIEVLEDSLDFDPKKFLTNVRAGYAAGKKEP